MTNVTKIHPAVEALSEDALALEFTRRHGNDWCYVAAFGKWFHWDGTRWLKERTLKVFDLARKVCRDAAASTGSPSKASAKTVAAVETLARSDRAHARADDVWDLDLMAINTPGGIVNLETGDIRPHSRTAYMTKITNAIPRGTCSLWLKFLDDVTSGDGDYKNYLARVAGYLLTGSTKEEALFFLHGNGNNGKSVFIETITRALGDYSTTAGGDTFTVQRHESHPTDLASMRGSRLVSCNELEKGKQWAEAKIKAITGSTIITARFMRQDFFEYQPQFKLMIAGNNKPSLSSVDTAIRRRFHLLPFTVTVSEENRNLDLKAELWEERDGIMQWMLDGCLEWKLQGLNPPSKVVAATKDYLDSEDNIGLWIAECCTTEPGDKGYVNDLHDSWKAWNEGNRSLPTGRKTFSADMQKHDFLKDSDNAGYFFWGIARKPAEEPPVDGTEKY